MATFVFVRHGESLWNLEWRLMGYKIGSRLSEKWIQQVRKSAEYLKSAYPHLSKIYSSPVSRALETAELIAADYGAIPQIVPELREIDFGDMTWKLISEIPKEIDKAYFKNPYEYAHTNWESLKDVQGRVAWFMDGAIARANGDDVIIVVTHDNVIRAIIWNLRGLTKEICYMKIEHASIIVYEITNDALECIDFNKKV